MILKFDSYLWIPSKAAYVKGDAKPQVECVLCAIRDRDERVKALEVWRGKLSVVVLNLYPYNPGHVMVFPKRHVEALRELGEDEALDIFRTVNLSITSLRHLYQPQGFNVGINIGSAAGASIEHLHIHVVPRYNSELGFVDIIGGGKVMIEDPERYLERMRDAFSTTSGDEP